MSSLPPLGASDCERLRDGLIAQPVNSISSLAYVVAGVWVLRQIRHVEPPRRPLAAAYGVALVGLGVGSAGFHGPGTAPARWLHDLSLADLALVIAVFNAALALGVPARRVLPGYLTALTGFAVLFAALPGTSIAVAAATAAAAVVGEVSVRRRVAGPGRLPRRRVGGWGYPLGIATLGASALVH